MTDSSAPPPTNPPEQPGVPAPGGFASDDDASAVTPARPRLGAGTFTIEGRAAPGLFVLGWLASLLGIGITFVGWQAGTGPGALLVLGVGLLLLTIGLVAGGGSQAIERRRRGEAYAGPSPFLVFAASIALAGLLAIAVGGPLSALGVSVSGPVQNLILLSLQVVAYVVVVGLVVVGTGALSWREMGFRAAGAGTDLGWGVVFAAPVFVVTVLLTAVLVALVGVTPEAPLPPTGQPAGLAANLLTGAILAPVGEELVFRGVATTAWVRSLGMRQGIMRAALFFAVAHVLSIVGTTFDEAARLAVLGFVARLPVAFVLGWVFVRRGSIWAPIGLHAAFNAIQLVLAEALIGAAR